MADLSDGANWSELDANNNKASPNGWPEGMMPSGVNDSARNDKGALKRFWNKANPVQAITPAGGVWTFTTTNPTYPTAYVDGEVYSFRPLAASAAGDSFVVGTLDAKPIWKAVSGGTGWAPIGAGDIALRRPVTLAYDSTLNAGAGAFVMLNPFVPVTAGGGLAVPGPISSTGTVTSTGPGAGVGFDARDDAAAHWLWYAAGGSARLWMGADKAIISSAGTLTIGAITYAGLEGHSISFGWDGSALIGHVDGTASPGRLVAWNSSPTLGNISCGTITSSTINTGGGGITTAGLQVNGNAAVTGILNIGGTQLYNASGYVYTPNAYWCAGPLRAQGTATFDGIITVGGLTLQNNAGYLYSPSNMRTTGLVVDGPVNAAGDVYCGGWYRGPTGARIQCFGGDWGDMTFSISGGYFVISPDGGASGFIYGPGSGFSDARLKTAIRNTKIDALAAVLATPVREFRWNAKGRKLMPHAEPVQPIGLVAQELEETMPGVVGTAPLADDTRHLIDQNITPYLVRAIQQLADRLTALEDK